MHFYNVSRPYISDNIVFVNKEGLDGVTKDMFYIHMIQQFKSIFSNLTVVMKEMDFEGMYF